jgi:hypothetical protein
MRYLIYFFPLLFLCYCNSETNRGKSDYEALYKQLVSSRDYMKFKGYEILPREENENIYEYDINELKLTLFITYEDDGITLNDHSKKILDDFLLRGYKTKSESVKKEIINKAYEQIKLMKKYNLQAVSSKRLPSDSTKWFIDFMLSNNKSLVYGNCFDSLYNRQNDFIKLDSEWVYIINKK